VSKKVRTGAQDIGSAQSTKRLLQQLQLALPWKPRLSPADTSQKTAGYAPEAAALG